MACMEHCLPCASLPWSRRDRSHEFSQLVDFLASVPFFQAQLPLAEMPRVAGRMRRRAWRRGATVLREGTIAGGFYVIYVGEASVITCHDISGETCSTPAHVANLQRGDTFGGRSHVRELQADFSVKAIGSGLVTLALTRKDLDELGLSTKLRFPKRAGMYEGVFGRDMPLKVSSTKDVRTWSSNSLPQAEEPLDEEEVAFVASALRGVPNLRALVSTDDDWSSRLAGFFTKRQVKAGTEIATAGDPGNEFYVLAEGSLGVYKKASTSSVGKTAEASVQAEKLTKLVARRHQFLQELSESAQNRKVSRAAHATSLCVVPSSGSAVGSRAKGPKSLHKSLREYDPAEVLARKVGRRHRTFSAAGGSQDEEYMSRLPSAGCKAITAALSKALPKEDDAPLDDCLRPHRTLSMPGETYGEMAVLYGAKYIWTARALTDTTLYAVRRRHFQTLRRESPKLEEYCKLLDEVPMLMPMIRAERRELARNAAGLYDFRAGERVLEQGVMREEPKWYVVAKGSCTISRRDAPGAALQQLGHLSRSGHFGERSILRGDDSSEYNVDAGPEGLTVLVFERHFLEQIALRLERASEGTPNVRGAGLPNLSVEPGEYMQTMLSFMSDKGSSQCPESASVLEPLVKLGEGGFGDVFLVRSTVSEQQYALKQINIAKCKDTGALDQVRTERDIMAMMDTPFVVHFCRAFTDQVNIFFVMEAVTGGHLFGLLCDHSDVLFSDSRPRGSAAMFYIACVTLALGYLHERHIAYRDIKMENVLLDSSGYAKLCDMGFARFVLGKTRTFLGTPDYMAPEIIDPPHAHDKNVDWFALGVLACELLTGQGPWDYHAEQCGNPLEMIVAVRECQSAGLPNNLLPAKLHLARDFLRQLLRVQARSRLGSGQGDAAEVRRHPWFEGAGFDFEALQARRLPSPWRPPEPEKPKAAPSSPPPGWAVNGRQLQEFV